MITYHRVDRGRNGGIACKTIQTIQDAVIDKRHILRHAVCGSTENLGYKSAMAIAVVDAGFSRYEVPVLSDAALWKSPSGVDAGVEHVRDYTRAAVSIGERVIESPCTRRCDRAPKVATTAFHYQPRTFS